MKALRLLAAAIALVSLLDTPLFANTICPTNFSCGFSAVATQAVTQSTSDGTPYSAVGVLNFDSSGTVSGSVTVNVNGTLIGPYFVGGGQCTSDASGTATLDFPTISGDPTFHFVATDSGRELRFINATAPGNLLLAGVGLCKVQ